MQKKLLSGLFWVLLANLLVKPLWLLGIEVDVQNTVGNEAYGFYFAVFNLSYILNILLDLGITNFNTRNIAQHPQLISKHLSGILGIKLCLLGLYVVVTFTVGALLGYGSQEFRLLAWLCLAQALNSLILYLRSNFEGLLLFRWDSLFSVLDRVLMIVICGCLLWGPRLSVFSFRFTVFHFVYAQVAAYSLTALLALAVIGRKARLQRLRFDRRFLLVILKQSAPFALLVLLMASYNRLDPILLRRLASAGAAGVYAGAFRLLDALTMVCYLVSVPLLPVFSKILADRDALSSRASLVDALRLVFWPMVLYVAGSAVACSLLAAPLMRLLYHDGAASYVPVFRVLVFCLVPIGLTYVFGTLLTAGGRLRQLNLLATVTLGLNVAANLLLIPRMGAVGSAWAALTAQSFMAAAQLALAVRLFRLPFSSFLPLPPRNIFHTIALMFKSNPKE
ncbi:MAG: oligosaccharide flippase family protein [Bacteroidales bacterium]|nr:oligosaccharide flippase family protein [Bacteroidales bacterium]